MKNPIIYPDLDDILYHRGKFFLVEWYFDEKGSLPGLKYYRSKLSKDERDRLDFIVVRVADTAPGIIHPKAIYNIEDKANGIYAFKPWNHRLFDFMTAGRKIIITNGYRKQSQKMKKKDKRLLRISIENKKSYTRRTKAGTYYPKDYDPV